jgi:hypothetical protein
MPEQEYVLDIVGPTELADLVPVCEIARYWQTKEEFVRKRLREGGVHLVKVAYPLMVRLSDIEQFEQAHTIYPGVET